jgi:serine/threonine-protein kinase
MRDIAPETVIDQRYSILERIGSGGMADVYAAQDLQLGRKVALKLLYRRFAEDEEFVERFKREASAAAGLQHPNVVGVYDRGEWDGTYYIAMEYLEGRSLKQIVQEEGPLSPEWAIEVVVQILRAARFAHQRGIIHRDIKPHNVIVDDEGRVKVTDFGIARAGASDMTETGSIMGTAQYLSPEQAQGHSVSAASDLYAIGIVLYECLSARVPFEGDSPVTIALKQVSEMPVPPSVYNPGVPPELDAIVLHALEKEPLHRFADADEFVEALEGARARLTALEPGEATAVFGAVTPPTAATVVAEPDVDPEEERRRRRRTLIAIAAAIALLLAGALLAFALTRPEKEPVPDVVGTQLAAASTVLRNAGFEVEVDRVTSDAPKDRVLRSDPQPGTEVEKGATVSLTVSDGPGQTTVPDVTNLFQRQAREALEEAGFSIEVERETSSTVDRGRVTRTSPPGGTLAQRASTVTMFVSTGPGKVAVPAVVGQKEGSAISELSNAGLRTDVSEEESDQPAGTVLRQDPAAGTSVDKGSTVAVVVAREPARVIVPRVVGLTERAAADRLSRAGLLADIENETVTDRNQKDRVIRQDPERGDPARRGDSVTIVIGRFEEPPPPVVEDGVDPGADG